MKISEVIDLLQQVKAKQVSLVNSYDHKKLIRWDIPEAEDNAK